MARGKKTEKVLTLEEKLEQALVPVEEQPYPVPENWCWVQMRWVIESSKEKTEDFSIPDVKYIGLEHIEKDNGITGYASTDGIKSLKNIFHPRQILYGKLRPYLNKHDVATFDGVCSTDILVFNSRKTALPEYINYYFNHRDFIEYTVANSKGINLPRVSEDTVLGALCPLPPLAEQQRIVDRIGNLFFKLDEAKEKLQAVLDSFEIRKVTILHKVFAKELTEKWRHKNSLGIETWELMPLEKVFVIRSGTSIPIESELSEGKIPYVKVADMNLTENLIQITTSSRFVNECPDSHAIPYGSIIFPKRGGAILTNKKRFVGVDAIIADLNTMAIIPRKDIILSWYGYYWMQSVDLRELNNGSNVPQINNKDMINLKIPIPSLKEQAEIVRILDNLFAKERQAKEVAEVVLDQINIIKKSILARAFRGELGTNNPNEDSSLELIKQIFSETIGNDSILKLKKIKRIEVEFVPKTIMEVLAGGARLTPEKLKYKTGLEIDDFYGQLKELIDNGQIIETRMDGESYLEAIHAD